MNVSSLCWLTHKGCSNYNLIKKLVRHISWNGRIKQLTSYNINEWKNDEKSCYQHVCNFVASELKRFSSISNAVLYFLLRHSIKTKLHRLIVSSTANKHLPDRNNENCVRPPAAEWPVISPASSWWWHRQLDRPCSQTRCPYICRSGWNYRCDLFSHCQMSPKSHCSGSIHFWRVRFRSGHRHLWPPLCISWWFSMLPFCQHHFHRISQCMCRDFVVSGRDRRHPLRQTRAVYSRRILGLQNWILVDGWCLVNDHHCECHVWGVYIPLYLFT